MCADDLSLLFSSFTSFTSFMLFTVGWCGLQLKLKFD